MALPEHRRNQVSGVRRYEYKRWKETKTTMLLKNPQEACLACDTINSKGFIARHSFGTPLCTRHRFGRGPTASTGLKNQVSMAHTVDGTYGMTRSKTTIHRTFERTSLLTFYILHNQIQHTEPIRATIGTRVTNTTFMSHTPIYRSHTRWYPW
jgi:hypothetical protein